MTHDPTQNLIINLNRSSNLIRRIEIKSSPTPTRPSRLSLFIFLFSGESHRRTSRRRDHPPCPLFASSPATTSPRVPLLSHPFPLAIALPPPHHFLPLSIFRRQTPPPPVAAVVALQPATFILRLPHLRPTPATNPPTLHDFLTFITSSLLPSLPSLYLFLTFITSSLLPSLPSLYLVSSRRNSHTQPNILQPPISLAPTNHHPKHSRTHPVPSHFQRHNRTHPAAPSPISNATTPGLLLLPLVPNDVAFPLPLVFPTAAPVTAPIQL